MKEQNQAKLFKWSTPPEMPWVWMTNNFQAFDVVAPHDVSSPKLRRTTGNGECAGIVHVSTRGNAAGTFAHHLLLFPLLSCLYKMVHSFFSACADSSCVAKLNCLYLFSGFGTGQWNNLAPCTLVQVPHSQVNFRECDIFWPAVLCQADALEDNCRNQIAWLHFLHLLF